MYSRMNKYCGDGICMWALPVVQGSRKVKTSLNQWTVNNWMKSDLAGPLGPFYLIFNLLYGFESKYRTPRYPEGCNYVHNNYRMCFSSSPMNWAHSGLHFDTRQVGFMLKSMKCQLYLSKTLLNKWKHTQTHTHTHTLASQVDACPFVYRDSQRSKVSSRNWPNWVTSYFLHIRKATVSCH